MGQNYLPLPLCHSETECYRYLNVRVNSVNDEILTRYRGIYIVLKFREIRSSNFRVDS